MADFLILGGGGMQGKIVARDLLESGRSIFLADLYEDGAGKIVNRYPEVKFAKVDLRDLAATARLIREVGPSVVVNCAEGDWNLNVYKVCLAEKKNVIDLGSDIPMTRDQLAMHGAYREAGITAITGCGSTPGVNNIMFRYVHEQLDELEAVEAGFAWDANIKKFVVPFSIQSIIEEFTEPAPHIVNGEWRESSPMDTVEEREFRTIGRQKCFLVRHPETHTFYQGGKRDGLKHVLFYAGFPDHSFNAIKNFIDCGLASKEPIVVGGAKILPLDALTQTLRNVEPPDGYREKENLWVKVAGKKNGERREITMECLVDTIDGWEDAGCNIDTGMPASIIAQMVSDGVIAERGSFPPGSVVPPDRFFQALRRRQMAVCQNGRLIN